MADDTTGTPSPDLLAAFRTMIEQLTFAFSPDISEKTDALGASTVERSRYIRVSLAVAELLYTMGKKELSDHLHFLAGALQDLSDGIPHPLFKVETRVSQPGVRPDISALWVLRANVCIGIEFMDAGGADDAIGDIAKEYGDQLKKLGRAKKDITASLRNWRKKFAYNEIENDFAVDTYREGMERLQLAKLNQSGDALILAGRRLIATAVGRWARVSST